MKTIITLWISLFLIPGLGKGTYAHGLNGHLCPDATISYPGSPYCSNSGYAKVIITGTGGGVFSSGPGLAINPNFGFVDLSASIPGTYVVTYFIAGNSDNDCGDFTTTTDITIATAPSANISYPGSPYCISSGIINVVLNGTTGGVFSSDSGLSIDPSSGDIDRGASIPGNYVVAYTIPASGSCGNYVALTQVTINDVPNAAISYGNTAYCNNAGNALVNFTGTGGGGFSSSNGLSIDPNTGEIDCQASVPGSYVITYSVSNNCGTASTTTSVDIDAAPIASISYDNSPYCKSVGIAKVNLTGTPGGSFTSTTGLAIDQDNGNIDLGSTVPGTYTVTYTVNIGNCSATTIANITVSEALHATISYSNSPYCSTVGTANVNLTGSTGGTFSAGRGLEIDNNTGDIDLAASTPGTYTITYYIPGSTSCGSFITTTNITILPTPTASFYYPNSPYCTNLQWATVSFAGLAGGTFSSDPGLVIDPVTGTVDIQASVPGNYMVYYSLSTACGNITTGAHLSLANAVCFHGVQLPVTGNGSINIYPNPVEGRMINIRVNGIEKGKYVLKLINMYGDLAQYNQVDFKGGTTIYNIRLGYTIRRGYYQVDMIHPDGKRTSQKIFVLE